MTTDVCQFGGFAHGLVETLRDEYPKLPVLDFALLSSAVPADVDVDDVRSFTQWLGESASDLLRADRGYAQSDHRCVVLARDG